MEYGTLDFNDEVIGDFQGDLDIEPNELFKRILRVAQENPIKDSNRFKSAVKSRDAKLNHLYAAVINNASHMAHIEL